eukprot:bmy_16739T0
MNPHIKQNAQCLHGDIAQSQREITLKGFREAQRLIEEKGAVDALAAALAHNSGASCFEPRSSITSDKGVVTMTLEAQKKYRMLAVLGKNLTENRGVAGQVAGQVVDLVADQVDRVDRGVGQEVDKMVEDEVRTEIDREAGATNRVLTEIVNLPVCYNTKYRYQNTLKNFMLSFICNIFDMVFHYHSYSGWQDIVSTSLSMYHASDILAARVWSWTVGVNIINSRKDKTDLVISVIVTCRIAGENIQKNSSVSTIIVKSPNEKSNFPLMIWVSEMLRSNCVLEVRKQIKKGDHESTRAFAVLDS